MPFIGQEPLTGAYHVLDAITTSATATYNLQLNSGAFSPATANQLLVSLNGVIQKPGSSFTVSGSQITFSSALTSSDSIDFIIALGDVLNVGTPTDGSVATAKIAPNAVVGSKLASDIGISTTGNIATTGSGTLTSAGLITASAGVAVGGTGAANTLDDYEEGTWTPTITAVTTPPNSITSGEGVYTKVGNQVIVFGIINNINITNAVGNARIEGLPFPCQTSISGGSVPGSLYGNQLLIGGLSTASYTVVEATTGQSYLQIRLIRTNNANAAVMTLTSTYFTDDQTDLRFQITYRTGS
jgi:hypothetical protein